MYLLYFNPCKNWWLVLEKTSTCECCMQRKKLRGKDKAFIEFIGTHYELVWERFRGG